MARIVIFDSGVGGLSIHQEIQAQMPQQELFFVCDNLAYPYGTKKVDELQSRVSFVVGQIVKQYAPDILVIACNTASTVVLPSLRAQFSLPIVGVVPAIKPAAKLSKTGNIGLLATPATVQRAYTQELIDSYASQCQIIRYGSSKLVQLAEDKLYGKRFEQIVLERELSHFSEHKKIDTLVLACTHFPLLNNEIENYFKVNNHKITILDSALAIAHQVQRLKAQLPESSQPSHSQSRAVFTQSIASQTSFIENLRARGFTNIEHLKTTNVESLARFIT